MPGFNLTNQYTNYNKTYLSKNSNVVQTSGTESAPYKSFNSIPVYKLNVQSGLTSSSVQSDIKPAKNVLIIGSGNYYENLISPSFCIKTELHNYVLPPAYSGSIPDVQYFNLEIVGDGNVVITDKSDTSFELSYRSFINFEVDTTSTTTNNYIINLTLRNLKFDYYYNPLELILITRKASVHTITKTVTINLTCIDCEFSRVNIRHNYYNSFLTYFDETNSSFATPFFSDNLNNITVLYRNSNFINCIFTNKLKMSDFPVYFNLREEGIHGSHTISAGIFAANISNINLIKNCTFSGYNFVHYCRINSLLNTNFDNNLAVDSDFNSVVFTPLTYDIKMFSYNNYNVQTNDLFSPIGLSESNIYSIGKDELKCAIKVTSTSGIPINYNNAVNNNPPIAGVYCILEDINDYIVLDIGIGNLMRINSNLFLYLSNPSGVNNTEYEYSFSSDGLTFTNLITDILLANTTFSSISIIVPVDSRYFKIKKIIDNNDINIHGILYEFSSIIKTESYRSNSYNPKYLNYRKQDCSVATTSAYKTNFLISVVYNGSSITISSTILIAIANLITIDGITLSITPNFSYNNTNGIRVLVKNGYTSSGSQTIINNSCNGIYYIDFYQTFTSPYFLRLNRADDNTTYFDIQNTQTFITQGLQNSLTGWELTSELSTNWLNENKIFKRLYNIPENNASSYNINTSINSIRLNSPTGLSIKNLIFYLNIDTSLSPSLCAKLIPIYDSTGIIMDFYILYPGEYSISSYIESIEFTQADIVFSAGILGLVCLNASIFSLVNNYNFKFNFKRNDASGYFYLNKIIVDFNFDTFNPEPYAYNIKLSNASDLQLIQPKIAVITEEHMQCLDNINLSSTDYNVRNFIIFNGGQGFDDNITYIFNIKYWYGDAIATYFLDDLGVAVNPAPSILQLEEYVSSLDYSLNVNNTNNISINKTSSLYRESYESQFIGGIDNTQIIPFISYGNKNSDFFEIRYSSGIINANLNSNYIDESDDTIIKTQQVSNNLVIYGTNTIVSNIIDLGEVSKIDKINLNGVLNGLNIQSVNGIVGKKTFGLKWGDTISAIDGQSNFSNFEIGTTPFVSGNNNIGNADNGFDYNNRKYIYARYIKIQITLS